MILVTTAGKVGSETVRFLRQKGLPVRVLIRDPEKVQSLAEIGAEIIVGDLDSLASIDKAMQGVQTVVLVSPGLPTQELNVVQSAKSAGVEQVIKVTNDASADSPIARRRWQHEIEARLLASGLNFTLLRSNAYMQNVLAFAPAIKKTSGFGSSAGLGRIGMIDARDVAAVAVEIATSSASHVGKTYKLTGPRLLTYSDVAATLSKILGRPINYHELSSEEDKNAMIQAGFPKEVAEMNAQFFRMVAGGDSGWLSEDAPPGTLIRSVCHRLRFRIFLIESVSFPLFRGNISCDCPALLNVTPYSKNGLVSLFFHLRKLAPTTNFSFNPTNPSRLRSIAAPASIRLIS
jgi:uncharacterized protein YbjT (DUF2867 family)